MGDLIDWKVAGIRLGKYVVQKNELDANNQKL